MTSAKKPNVIFILSDDQGPWALGCSGNREIRTPNIDKLAAEGTKFENFFCTSPVCSPARASLMTGKIPSQHGVHDWIRDGNMPPEPEKYLEGMTCYSDILNKNGYVCGLSGKWHLGDSLIAQHGFSHWFCHQKGGGVYNNAPMVKNGIPVDAEGYISDVIADDAMEFITAHTDTPFYLSVHFTAPHSPWTGHPQHIVDSYDSCEFTSCPQEPIHPWAGPLTYRSHGNKEMLKGYFAAVTAMDDNIGRILQHVEQLGLSENTLIIFTSDNGFSCGHHGFWGKGNGTFPINMYDNSVKVPFILSQPGTVPQGQSVQTMASQYDFFPFLLEYLGISVPDDPQMPGRSFLPVVMGFEDSGDERVVVYDEYGPVRMIRTKNWKYIHRYPYGNHELYHLVNDPDERENIIATELGRKKAAEMTEMLSQWFARYVDQKRNGSGLPVTGSGQKARIGSKTPENCFYTDRIVDSECGVPKVRDWGSADDMDNLIADT